MFNYPKMKERKYLIKNNAGNQSKNTKKAKG